ncbi:MAG TPA: DUF1569 domain-containing protein [Terriglobales bacterium]|nr:DUF1569 domain-containing protein [Terriglobales bacterium]
MQPLEKLRYLLAASIAGLTEEQLRWHPPGKWCALEVLDHLYLTYTGTIKGFERVLAAGKPNVTPATWRQRGRKLVVLRLGYLPSGRKAPPSSHPRGLPAGKVLAEIVPKIAEMDQCLSTCEQKLGRGELLDHPIIGPLTAAQWKKFHLVHGLLHLKQIRRLRLGAAEKK